MKNTLRIAVAAASISTIAAAVAIVPNPAAAGTGRGVAEQLTRPQVLSGRLLLATTSQVRHRLWGGGMRKGIEDRVMGGPVRQCRR